MKRSTIVIVTGVVLAFAWQFVPPILWMLSSDPDEEALEAANAKAAAVAMLEDQLRRTDGRLERVLGEPAMRRTELEGKVQDIMGHHEDSASYRTVEGSLSLTINATFLVSAGGGEGPFDASEYAAICVRFTGTVQPETEVSITEQRCKNRHLETVPLSKLELEG